MNELNNKNPFKTPEGYFDTLSDSLKDRLSEVEKGLPGKDGFVVPDHYFDGLQGSIQQKLEAEATKVIPFHSYRKYYYVAASVAAVMLLAFVLNRNTSQKVTFEDIANSDIENYFNDSELDFSPYEIAEVIPIDELEIGDMLTENLNEDSILNYIDYHTENAEELNMEYDE